MHEETLPSHARLIAGPEVWIEGDAVRQLAAVAMRPGCSCAVGLPDLHAGPGIPIGAAFAFEHEIWPSLVGSDAGCGALVLGLRKSRHAGQELLRRAEAEMAEPLLPEVAPDRLLRAVWERGPAGLIGLDGVPEDLAEIAALLPPDLDGPSGPIPEGVAGLGGLGTLGGGNHFAEVSRVEKVSDRAAAAALGLTREGTALLVHTGSRAVGKALSDLWGDRAVPVADAEAYQAQLRGAVRFARANRLLVAWRLLLALGAARADRIGGLFDVVHNTVVSRPLRGVEVQVHRKGAAPAEAGQPTVVLASRGALSWVLLGTGDEATLATIAHGAGRRMGRSEARAKLSIRHTRQSLQRTATGGRVLCPDTDLLYEEHPDAYKAIDPVVGAIEAAGLATRVAGLGPMLTVKT